MSLPGLELPGEFPIAPRLTLPADADARRIAFVGMSGSGKTSSAKVVVEHLARAGRRIAVIDPAGVWSGLRVGSDGSSPGLPFVVFGGRSGDVPLEATAGAAVADLVMGENLPVILDLSGFEGDADLCRVSEDFVRRLRFLQSPEREPLLLVVDEADLLAPQTARKEQQGSQRALINVARRSRSDGLGLLVITQRPAAITKDILTQAEAVFILRFAGYTDLSAVDDWIGSYLSRDERQSVIAALPSLSEGEAYVTSPSWMRAFTRVQFPLPTTFDSSATPKAGGARPATQARAGVDLSALAARFARAIREEQENDPEELKRRIAGLQARLRDAPEPSGKVVTVEKVVEKIVERVVEVPAFVPGQVEQLRDTAEALIAGGKDTVALGQEILARIGSVQDHRPGPSRAPAPVQQAAPPADAVSAVKTPSTAPETETRKAGDAGALPGGAQRMLQTLARCHRMHISEAQLGSLTRLTPSGGTWSKYLGILKSERLVAAQGGRLQITPKGLARLGRDVPPEPRTTEDVLALWEPALANKEREMLRLLVSLHPKGITAEGLAQRLNLTHGAGTFGKYLGTLRSNGLVKTTSAGVSAGDVLFPNG